MLKPKDHRWISWCTTGNRIEYSLVCGLQNGPMDLQWFQFIKMRSYKPTKASLNLLARALVIGLDGMAKGSNGRLCMGMAGSCDGDGRACDGLIESLRPTNEEEDLVRFIDSYKSRSFGVAIRLWWLFKATMGNRKDGENQANDLATLYQKLKETHRKLLNYKQDERIPFKENECVKKEFVSPKTESKDSSSSSSKTHIKLLSEEKGDSNGDGDDERDDDGAAIDDGAELASLSLVASRTLSAYVKGDVQRENLFSHKDVCEWEALAI
ncbi:hypothetical protein CCACVL1_04505 [Corchorus capsularis]|uniref:Uncharacterized protein n=1 Tax=Corchorus capsularis TaxID=210143 RepID=A0A1R3JS33_COCAP|nr:hypothetical protein CCACVL1_04505 [Corchorus capsularis]